MTWFKIYAGLGGGFGGATYRETLEFADKEEAEEYAYTEAKQIYDSYEGMYGLRSVEEIVAEDDVDENSAEETYNDEREGWLEYHVKEASGSDDEDDGEEIED